MTMKADVALLLDAVNGDAVGMVERRGRARFVEQALGRLAVADLEHLDGDRAVEPGVAGAVHRPHAALSEASLDPVVQQPRADHPVARRI